MLVFGREQNSIRDILGTECLIYFEDKIICLHGDLNTYWGVQYSAFLNIVSFCLCCLKVLTRFTPKAVEGLTSWSLSPWSTIRAGEGEMLVTAGLYRGVLPAAWKSYHVVSSDKQPFLNPEIFYNYCPVTSISLLNKVPEKKILIIWID